MASVSTGGGGLRKTEELADLGPGEALVAGCGDGVGQHAVGLGDEAGEGVQADRAVAEPVRSAHSCQGFDGVGEDGGAVGIDPWRGQLAGRGEAQRLAGHDAFSSSRASSPSKIFCRPSWPWSAASSRWRCRVGWNSMVVWKKVQLSQMDSK